MSADPFNHPFPKRTDTMSMSTINERDIGNTRRFNRDSSFQRTDIFGCTPTRLVPLSVTKPNFVLSTFVQPNDLHSKKVQKVSDSLKISDIEGTQSKSKCFRTNRITDPLCPSYKLPQAGEITQDNGRDFIRDTLKIDDIAGKRQNFRRERGLDILNEVIPGSKPKTLTYQLGGISSLQVNDINKQGFFESKRTTNPLVPVYKWRDQQTNGINNTYGRVQGAGTRQKHPVTVNKQDYTNLRTDDIEGAKHNSYYDKTYFIGKRRDIRDYMQTGDIENSQSSSLKKGIVTQRATNPLVPNYRLPGHTQPAK